METDKLFGDETPDMNDSEKLLELKATLNGMSQLLVQGLKNLGSYQDLLLDELEDNERARDFLARSQEIVAGMESMAQALEAMDDGLEEGEHIGIASLLQGVIGQSQGDFAARSVGVELKCGDDVSFSGNVCQIQRLFSSVLRMMCFAMPVESVLRVEVEERELNDVQLRQLEASCSAGRYVMVTVGMKDVERKGGFSSIGAMMTSGSEAYIPRSELVWWLGMARHCGGDVCLSPDSSEPGLCILFPRVDVAAEKPKADDDLRGRETILLVDDEDMIWDVAIDKLISLGYTVLLAGNGREAVEMYQGNPGGIDLVIMDMVMPEMNGREAFERLRKLDSQVKVLFSSGYVAEEDAQSVMSSGAAGFLRKPYRLVDLARQVRHILDR